MDNEKVIERKLGEGVLALGGWSIKLLSTYVTGLPDRLVLVGGKTYFVEVKSERKKPTARQVLVHKQLAKIGFEVHVIDTLEKLGMFLKEIDK